MAAVTAADTIRQRVERTLVAESVDLTSERGRARAESLIEDTLRHVKADQLAGDNDPGESLDGAARELRDELIGLGAVAEQMLSDPEAQEWMINPDRSASL